MSAHDKECDCELCYAVRCATKDQRLVEGMLAFAAKIGCNMVQVFADDMSSILRKKIGDDATLEAFAVTAKLAEARVEDILRAEREAN